MRIMSRTLPIAALCLLLSGVAGGIPASGQESALGGFTTAATAATTAWAYDQPSSGVPASPTMEINGVYSETNLGSGPNGYGLASLMWPGQTAANAGGFVWATFWLEAKRGGFPAEYEPSIPPPNYPVRAETFYPQGPETDSQPLAGMQMRSRATRELTEASADVDRSALGEFVKVGNQTSRATSEVAEGWAVSKGSAVANDISLLGGLITFEAVVTEAFAASNSKTAEVGGSVTITGAVVDGRPVRIDAAGVHAEGNDADPGFTTVQQSLRQVLAQAGVTLAVADAVELVEGASASNAVGGLIVSIDAAAFRQHVQRLPEGLREQIEQNVAMDQSLRLSIASVAVSAAATEGFGFDFLDEDFGSDVAGFGFEDPGSGEFEFGAPGEVFSDGASVAAPPLGGDAGPAAAGSRAPIPGPFDGIPVGLVVAALLAAAALSRFLAGGADRALAAGAASRCPNEEPTS